MELFALLIEATAIVVAENHIASIAFFAVGITIGVMLARIRNYIAGIIVFVVIGMVFADNVFEIMQPGSLREEFSVVGVFILMMGQIVGHIVGLNCNVREARRELVAA